MTDKHLQPQTYEGCPHRLSLDVVPCQVLVTTNHCDYNPDLLKLTFLTQVLMEHQA